MLRSGFAQEIANPVALPLALVHRSALAGSIGRSARPIMEFLESSGKPVVTISINANALAMSTQRHLGHSQRAMASAMERLSSGLRVNSARDDAAGLAIAERMDARLRGLQVAIRNANDGVSMLQVVDGALSEVASILQRKRELAVQAASDGVSDDDRANLDLEYQALGEQLNDIENDTTYNDTAILDWAPTLDFHVDAEAGSAATVTIAMDNFMTWYGAGPADWANVATQSDASDAIDDVDLGIDFIASERARYGALQSRLLSAISGLQVAVENQAASRGRIVDADFAVETAALARAQVLRDAGTAMLAQANVIPQSVLRLLE